ncbi:MAG: T9SS type A sorting domain-containing protein [Bacteroidota bacterium]
MKKIYTICLFLLSSISMLPAQQIQEFSDLSASMANLFNAVRTNEGIVYFINDGERNKLVQIDFNGDIVEEKALPFVDSIYYNGHLFYDETGLYLIGHERLFPNGTNNQAVWNSQMRSVLQFDEQLALSSIHTFPTIPFGGGEVVTASGTSVGTHNPTSVASVDGQLISVWPYIIFDTEDNFSVLGRANILEVIDLEEESITTNVLDNTSLNLGVVFQDDHFLLLGETADTILGNGVALNLRPIGQYNYDGDLLETIDIDLQASGAFSDGVVGKAYDEQLFLSYFGRNLDVPGCTGNTAVLDRRDLNLNLLDRVKIPDCEFYPYGKQSISLAEDGSIYFSAIGANDRIGLYKYDSDLNLIWTEQLELPNHVPIGLKLRPNQGVILECLESDPTGTQIKLYAFNADGTVVSTQSIAINNGETIAFGPNPTNDWIYPLEGTDTSQKWRLYTVSGQLIANYQRVDQGIDLSHLPKGTYLLQGLDETGPIGIQKIVKQ